MRHFKPFLNTDDMHLHSRVGMRNARWTGEYAAIDLLVQLNAQMAQPPTHLGTDGWRIFADPTAEDDGFSIPQSGEIGPQPPDAPDTRTFLKRVELHNLTV